MPDLNTYVEDAKRSLYFSGAGIDQHLEAFLAEQTDNCRKAGENLATSIDQLYLVGSGGSYASMLTAKYAIDRFAAVSSEALPSFELIWRKSQRLNENSLVVLASYSGETEDSVAALRFANDRGAKTVAIVGKAESTMANEADYVVPYDSGAIFEIPIAAVILLAAGLEKERTSEIAEGLLAGLSSLPDVLRDSLSGEESRAETTARDLLSVQHLYVLGAGPNAPLAYKVAMSVVMENVRIGATYSDACEWRHGPAEALERVRGRFLVLLGTDESREMSQRTIEFCRAQGSDVTVFDAADNVETHPLLTPLVLNSQTQWLVVFSAILRGITDLDDRVFMGHNVLAKGGASWP